MFVHYESWRSKLKFEAKFRVQYMYYALLFHSKKRGMGLMSELKKNLKNVIVIIMLIKNNVIRDIIRTFYLNFKNKWKKLLELVIYKVKKSNVRRSTWHNSDDTETHQKYREKWIIYMCPQNYTSQFSLFRQN